MRINYKKEFKKDFDEIKQRKNYGGCLLSLKANDKRIPKLLEQLKTRGFDDSETWDLASCIGKFVYPRLKRFKEISIAYPAGLSLKKWNKILDDIIYSFEIINDDKRYNELMETKEWNKFKKGLKLFGEYLMDLWW